MKGRYRRILSLIICVMIPGLTDLLPFPAGEKTPGGKKP